uniref:Uncharacterized protein n=1 Tax=Palpitomonas bilix TaxID=652834 RepID=A0A7S3G7W0_9EUKA|mmetsp:Transcript_37318/g.96486  ORF Transcript_37318/g.96486 Transcript_37318/m.96486 type:complete len:811 (+) Transcript_37318:221-2653(+)
MFIRSWRLSVFHRSCQMIDELWASCSPISEFGKEKSLVSMASELYDRTRQEISLFVQYLNASADAFDRNLIVNTQSSYKLLENCEARGFYVGSPLSLSIIQKHDVAHNLYIEYSEKLAMCFLRIGFEGEGQKLEGTSRMASLLWTENADMKLSVREQDRIDARDLLHYVQQYEGFSRDGWDVLAWNSLEKLRKLPGNDVAHMLEYSLPAIRHGALVGIPDLKLLHLQDEIERCAHALQDKDLNTMDSPSTSCLPGVMTHDLSTIAVLENMVTDCDSLEEGSVFSVRIALHSLLPRRIEIDGMRLVFGIEAPESSGDRILKQGVRLSSSLLLQDEDSTFAEKIVNGFSISCNCRFLEPGRNECVLSGEVPNIVYSFARAELFSIAIGKLRLLHTVEETKHMLLRRFVRPSRASLPLEVSLPEAVLVNEVCEASIKVGPIQAPHQAVAIEIEVSPKLAVSTDSCAVLQRNESEAQSVAVHIISSNKATINLGELDAREGGLVALKVSACESGLAEVSVTLRALRKRLDLGGRSRRATYSVPDSSNPRDEPRRGSFSYERHPLDEVDCRDETVESVEEIRTSNSSLRVSDAPIISATFGSVNRVEGSLSMSQVCRVQIANKNDKDISVSSIELAGEARPWKNCSLHDSFVVPKWGYYNAVFTDTWSEEISKQQVCNVKLLWRLPGVNQLLEKISVVEQELDSDVMVSRNPAHKGDQVVVTFTLPATVMSASWHVHSSSGLALAGRTQGTWNSRAHNTKICITAIALQVGNHSIDFEAACARKGEESSSFSISGTIAVVPKSSQGVVASWIEQT